MPSNVSHPVVERVSQIGASRDIRVPERRFSEQGRLDGTRNDRLCLELTAVMSGCRGEETHFLIGDDSRVRRPIGSDESQWRWILMMVLNILWHMRGSLSWALTLMLHVIMSAFWRKGRGEQHRRGRLLPLKFRRVPCSFHEFESHGGRYRRERASAVCGQQAVSSLCEVDSTEK